VDDILSVDTPQGRTYDTTNLNRDAAGRLQQGGLPVGLLRNLATLLFVLALPAALVTSNIRFIANEPRIYTYAVDEYDAPRTTGIQRSELLRAGGEIRDYFNNSEETLSIRVQQNGREVPLFNPRETQHMKDVKDRFKLMNRVQEFSVIYVVTYVATVVLWSREVSTRGLAMAVAGGSVLALAAVGAAGALGLAGFESAWESFHEVLFSNDFWLLNPATDHLIQMFPPAFWENVVFLIGLLIAAEAALLLLGAVIYLGVTSHQPRSQRLTPNYA
jgi:integral membrane protein (TIGR01906 family)